MHALKVYVNGRERSAVVEPSATLLSLLRDELKLTGTKEGCGTGGCGACTVLVDGQPVNSCLAFAVDADHREVTTVEGLARETALHPLQAAFIECGALQCGFCTPGMLMSAAALLAANANPTEDDARDAIAGNLCRCTGYTPIVAAILAAARTMRDAGRAGERPGPRAQVRTRA